MWVESIIYVCVDPPFPASSRTGFPRYRAWQSHIQQAIAAPTTAFQHLHNAADHAPIVCLLDTSHIRMRLDPCHCSSRLPPKVVRQ
jgi:hypothetical protein